MYVFFIIMFYCVYGQMSEINNYYYYYYYSNSLKTDKDILGGLYIHPHI